MLATIWKLEDTPKFVAGRLQRASLDYIDKVDFLISRSPVPLPFPSPLYL